MTGKILYLPHLVTSRPLIVKVTSIPQTSGSNCSPELVGVAEKLAHRLKVVVIQVRFSDLRGIMGGENLYLHHVTKVVQGRDLLSAEITRNMQHEQRTLP